MCVLCVCVLLYLFTWLPPPHSSDSCPHAGDLENPVNYSNASVRRRKVTNTWEIRPDLLTLSLTVSQESRVLRHNEEGCFSCLVALSKLMLFSGIPHSCEEPWEALQDTSSARLFSLTEWLPPFHNPPMCLSLVEKRTIKLNIST